MKILIFEDDISIALEYEMILDKIGMGKPRISKTINNAETIISEYQPDLVILDIYLQDGLGVDLLPKLKQLDIPTIVITAFTEEKFAKIALDYQAEAFLGKPVDPNILKFEIRKIEELKRNKSSQNFFYMQSKNRMGKINLDEIICLITEGNYTTFITHRKKHVIKKSLSSILNELEGDDLIQVFRNIAVNVNMIKDVDFTNNSIILDSGKSVPLGDSYKKQLKLKASRRFKII